MNPSDLYSLISPKANLLGLHEGLTSLRRDLQSRLDQWERQLESAELQCNEYRQTAAEARARNSLLAEQLKQHQATTSELERTIQELK